MRFDRQIFERFALDKTERRDFQSNGEHALAPRSRIRAMNRRNYRSGFFILQCGFYLSQEFHDTSVDVELTLSSG
jgi:hypothetical protein